MSARRRRAGRPAHGARPSRVTLCRARAGRGPLTCPPRTSRAGPWCTHRPGSRSQRTGCRAPSSRQRLCTRATGRVVRYAAGCDGAAQERANQPASQPACRRGYTCKSLVHPPPPPPPPPFSQTHNACVQPSTPSRHTRAKPRAGTAPSPPWPYHGGPSRWFCSGAARRHCSVDSSTQAPLHRSCLQNIEDPASAPTAHAQGQAGFVVVKDAVLLLANSCSLCT